MTLLVSFYQDTPLTGTHYADHAKRLRAECKAVGQPASIVKRTYGDDYLTITRSKPLFMLEMLNKHKQNLVFVDVDATILAPFDYEPSRIAWAKKPDGKPYGHVHYLPYTPETISFLEAWVETLDGWEGGDHSAMWLTIKNTGIEWEELPNIGKRVRWGISQTEDSAQAQQYLESIDWLNTIKKRLQ